MHGQFLTVVSGIIKKMVEKRQQLQTWWKMECMNVKFNSQSVESLMETLDSLDERDREATPRPRRNVTCNGSHGASNEDDGDPTEDAAEPEPQVPDRVPTAEEGAAILLAAPPVPGDGVHGEEADDDELNLVKYRQRDTDGMSKVDTISFRPR